jgi:hypothetical protein
MEHEGSLYNSQEQIICPFPEPDECSSHSPTLFPSDLFQ